MLPKGTFGKVQQHKTQHQMLLSFTNTAGSRKRQFSTFIHELVRAECGKARTSVPFCLVSAPAAFVFTINLRETRSLWPSQFASHYSSGVIWHCCIHLLTYTVNTLCINCLHAAVELIFYLPTPSFHSTMFLASVFTGTGWSLSEPLKRQFNMLNQKLNLLFVWGQWVLAHFLLHRLAELAQ